jgi:hypothetical protein
LKDTSLIEKVLQQLSDLIYREDDKHGKYFLQDLLLRLGVVSTKATKTMQGTSGKFENLDSQPETLKSLLTKLKSEMMWALQHAAEKMKPQLLEKLQLMMERVDLIQKNILATQCVNILSRDTDNEYIFQIPFFMDEPETALIAVRYNSENEKGKGENVKENFSLQICFNTESLGEIFFYAQVSNKNVVLKIEATREYICQLISSQLKSFTLRLEALSYNVKEISCLMREKLSTQNVGRFFDLPGIGDFSLIDLKV